MHLPIYYTLAAPFKKMLNQATEMTQADNLWLCSFSNNLIEKRKNVYSVLAEKTTLINSINDSYKWEYVGYEKELNAYNYQGILQIQKGIRSVQKWLITFSKENRKEIVKAFNQNYLIAFNEVEEGFLVSLNVDYNYLQSIKGIEDITRVNILERKEYLPTLISTGIKAEELPVHNLKAGGRHVPFLVAGNQLILHNQEVYVPVYPKEDYTAIKKGEEIAQISFLGKVTIENVQDS